MRRALVFALLLAAAGTVEAGDAAGRRVIGFSPSGRYFAFEQYWAVYEEDASVSEIQVVDTLRDVFAPGSPVRVRVEGEEGLEPKKARALAAERARGLVEKYQIREPGRTLRARPSRDIESTDHYQLADPFTRSLDLVLPDGRSATIAVSERPQGTRNCRAGDRSGSTVRRDILGYELTLAVAGQQPEVIAPNARVPLSRGCPGGYGIAEAHLHTAENGIVTLVVLLEYADHEDGHLGPNRRFLAAPHRLAKP